MTDKMYVKFLPVGPITEESFPINFSPINQTNKLTCRKTYTSVEKNLLLELVKKYQHILLSKKSDATTNRLKAKIWEAVAKSFNSSNAVSQETSPEQLHRLWNNMRTRAKKAIRDAGLPPPNDPDKYDEDLFVPDVTMDVMDTIGNQLEHEPPTQRAAKPMLTINPMINPNINSSKDKNTLNPIISQTLNSFDPLGTSIHLNSNLETRKEIIRKEHEAKQRRADEIHALEMEILKETLKEAKAKADKAVAMLKSEQ